MTRLTEETASLYARTALGHVTREYPNKLDHVIVGPEAVQGPRALHPVFFGSFDWHSCVHGWWTLFTCCGCIRRSRRRRHPGLADELFTEANVAAETAYLAEPSSRGFERPYGWAWLLMLAGGADAARQRGRAAVVATLKPLADAFANGSGASCRWRPIRCGSGPTTTPPSP
jgi:hypothetical protein